MSLEEENQPSLSEALQKQGFKLEFEVLKIFKKTRKDYHESPRLNYSIKNNLGNEIACDLYSKRAEFRRVEGVLINYHFIVECKGTKEINKLALIEQAYDEYLIFSENSYSMIGIENAKLVNFKETYRNRIAAGSCFIFRTSEKHIVNNNTREGYAIAYSGDFFELSKVNGLSMWKKSSTQDDKNNLFKGIRQVVTASIYFASNDDELEKIAIRERDEDYQKPLDIIVPLIVTNAEINLKNYDSDSDDDSSIFKPNKVLYQTNGACSDLTNGNYIPYVIILSLDKLESFLESF